MTNVYALPRKLLRFNLDLMRLLISHLLTFHTYTFKKRPLGTVAFLKQLKHVSGH